jgi:HEPN domain-containing protein
MSDKAVIPAEWLRKAENDITSARVILAADQGCLDVVCFHAQQAVEKVLKAHHIVQGIPFRKIHDLDILLQEIDDSELQQYRRECIMLSTYAVEARYPGDYIEPEREEAEEALRVAVEIFELVKRKIGT